MELADGSDSGHPSAAAADRPNKRKMKSPYQLQVLENTYAVETYPSEAKRAELSAKIGLTDRQLQMWFCHRRLKDRKQQPPPGKRAKHGTESATLPPPQAAAVPDVTFTPPGPSSKVVARTSTPPRVRGDVAVTAGGGVGNHYYDVPTMLAPPVPSLSPQLSLGELRVIASVEAQIGEPLREDGPVLGVEFDPLPPGAFGAPIVTVQQTQPVRPYDGKLYGRHGAQSTKTSTFLPSMEHPLLPSSSSGKRKNAVGGSLVHPHGRSRALHEHQFLPEQPSIQSEAYERTSRSPFYDSPVVASDPRLSSFPRGRGQFLHGNEQVSPGYTLQGQIPSANLLPQQGRELMFPSGSVEYDSAPHSNSLTNTVNDTQFGIPRVMESENPFLSSDRRIFHDDDTSRVERKCKSEEAKVSKEVEAHEKRIRREFEKQDILRKKREEQMRKEMERHDRERRKEEERMLREKQREEERFQREQRREIVRREKFLQKESLRAEKLKQKEELRREKEAARLKAANERATARRLAKESTKLIEDERLELMEFAAASKGLSSIISLDSESIQQLDMFRDMLSMFPPKSVRFKRPFAVQPWTNSEENVGNLLMVWKFVITFVDILGLVPLTLDDFVQSLHDHDSKLLGELHVALLKCIIKDIEDAAKTPATALGANQNSATNPGGGHPQIVEGAYAWGFNISSWQCNLNPLTWPEVLRQFALSAGFGPQLKKQNVERTYFQDDHEGNDGKDVISILRNGAAAENAVAWMRERGYSRRRRSRHRLTPGTVKFAAFHVLSLEGSEGLTILEVADKIQKSGLRDLTTSKNPEASIAAALSRDTKLFERTAPSTYCVRPPFRKDPADADAILSAAREKIQIFESGLSDSEEAEKDAEDADDAERDEDSEGEIADDPEVDNASAEANLTRNIPLSNDSKDTRASSSLDNIKGDARYGKVGPTANIRFRNTDKGFSAGFSENSKVMNVSGATQSLDTGSNCPEASNADIEDTEIDESNVNDTWVEGLFEGEYADLTIEERLDALVTLICVATEGNSIRVILEERLEAATALKKQMWAGAQLDKRRFKEENAGKLQYSSLNGYNGDSTQINAVAEGSQIPPHMADNNCNDMNVNPVNNDTHIQSNINSATSNERDLSGHEFVANPDTEPHQQYGHVAEKSRSQLKSYFGHIAEEQYEYRSLPLGQDRSRNRYWQFSASASPDDPGSGRIFFESKDGFWRLIDSEEAFDSLLATLDTRGIRESHLHSMLRRIEPTFKETIRRYKKSDSSVNLAGNLVEAGSTEMTSSPDCSTGFDSPSRTLSGLAPDTLEKSSSFNIELGRNRMERNSSLERYNDFLKWMWEECYSHFRLCAMKYGKKRCLELLQTCHLCYHSYFAEERHCPSCHRTFKFFHTIGENFPEHVAQCEEKRKTDPDWKPQVSDSFVHIGICLLKAQLSLIEASIPEEALQTFWTEDYRKSWGVKLQSSSSTEDILQILTLLEGAIKRDCLSSTFETTNEVLSYASGADTGCTASISGPVPVLPCVPDTMAAVALRLMDLDTSISYMKLESLKEKEGGVIVKLPSRYTVVKNFQELARTGTLDQVDYHHEKKWLNPGSGYRGRGRGIRGQRGRARGRGGRVGRGLGSSTRADINEGSAINYEKTTRKYTRRGRARARGRNRGGRIGKPRQISDSRVTMEKVAQFGSFHDLGSSAKQDSTELSPRSLGGDEWQLEETGMPYIEDDDDSIGYQSDENGQASGDESGDQPVDYARVYVGSRPSGLMYDESEEDADGNDGVDDDEEIHTRDELDADVDDEYEEDIADEDGMEAGDEQGNGDDDEEASSYSSEYSD